MFFLQSVVIAISIIVGLLAVIYLIGMCKWIAKDYPYVWEKIVNWVVLFCFLVVMIHCFRMILL